MKQALDVDPWPGGGAKAVLVRDVESEYAHVVVGLPYGGDEGDGVWVGCNKALVPRLQVGGVQLRGISRDSMTCSGQQDIF